MATISVVATSDLHGYLPEIPSCDLLLLGGDLCPDGDEKKQADWLDTTFRRWLKTTNAKEVVAVAGNHDFLFQNRPALVPELPWHYLQDSGVELYGFHIWGTPWQPTFFDWAFNLDEPDLVQRWHLIPDDTDILLLHGPPHGKGDRNSHGEHTGSPGLTRHIEAVQPRLAICGHIHEARGEYWITSTRVLNVSQLDLRYEPYPEICQLELSAHSPLSPQGRGVGGEGYPSRVKPS